MVPESVSIAADRGSFCLQWPGGDAVSLSAETVRANCRSAKATRERLDSASHVDFTGITIAEIETIGIYGLNIRFSDGHDRGIYPWAFLRELASSKSPLNKTAFIEGAQTKRLPTDRQG